MRYTNYLGPEPTTNIPETTGDVTEETGEGTESAGPVLDDISAIKCDEEYEFQCSKPSRVHFLSIKLDYSLYFPIL